MNGWYLVCCKRGKIGQAELSLARLGVIIFCPLIRAEKSRSNSSGKRVRIEPAFPPYIFAQFDPWSTLISKIKSSPGVKYLVAFGGEPKPLPSHVIDVLMQQTCDFLFKNDSEQVSGDVIGIRKEINIILANSNGEERVRSFLALLARVVNNGLFNSQLAIDDGI